MSAVCRSDSPKIPLGYEKILHGTRDEQMSICSPPKGFLDTPTTQHRKQDHVCSGTHNLASLTTG